MKFKAMMMLHETKNEIGHKPACFNPCPIIKPPPLGDNFQVIMLASILIGALLSRICSRKMKCMFGKANVMHLPDAYS